MVACPSCGIEVMQKAMIPVGEVDRVPHYLCLDCSRKLIQTSH